MSFEPRFVVSNALTADLTRIERARKGLCPGTNRRTLQRDLKDLVGKGLITEAATGPTDPTRHYRLGDGLQRPGAEL